MGFNPEDKTILVVDDESDLCEILQFDLEDAGYQTMTASQAHEALEIIGNNHIDLVISDIRMPGGDGVFLLESLREKDYKEPPIIFVSGFADISLEEAYAKGVNSVFAKPLATDSLLEYVEQVLKEPMERWKKQSEWNHEIRFERSFPSLADAFATRALLLGRGGAFLLLDKDFPRIGTDFYFKFCFEDTGSVLEGLATCRWQWNSKEDQAHNGIGLEFKELSDESIVFVTKLAQEQKTIPQIPKITED